MYCGPSVTSPYSTKTDKRRITQTTPHNSLLTDVNDIIRHSPIATLVEMGDVVILCRTKFQNNIVRLGFFAVAELIVYSVLCKAAMFMDVVL